jgi:hypothetical protein
VQQPRVLLLAWPKTKHLLRRSSAPARARAAATAIIIIIIIITLATIPPPH